MKKSLMILPLVLMLCLAFSCQQGRELAEEVKAEQEEPKEVMALTQERQAIAEANVKFGEIFSTGNASALADLYTEDAWLVSQTGEMFKGREGIETFWAGAFQMGMKYLRQGKSNLWNFAKNDFHFFYGMNRLISLFYDSIIKGTPVPIPYEEISRISSINDEIFKQLNQG